MADNEEFLKQATSANANKLISRIFVYIYIYIYIYINNIYIYIYKQQLETTPTKEENNMVQSTLQPTCENQYWKKVS